MKKIISIFVLALCLVGFKDDDGFIGRALMLSERSEVSWISGEIERKTEISYAEIIEVLDDSHDGDIKLHVRVDIFSEYKGYFHDVDDIWVDRNNVVLYEEIEKEIVLNRAEKKIDGIRDRLMKEVKNENT